MTNALGTPLLPLMIHCELGRMSAVGHLRAIVQLNGYDRVEPEGERFLNAENREQPQPRSVGSAIQRVASSCSDLARSCSGTSPAQHPLLAGHTLRTIALRELPRCASWQGQRTNRLPHSARPGSGSVIGRIRRALRRLPGRARDLADELAADRLGVLEVRSGDNQCTRKSPRDLG